MKPSPTRLTPPERRGEEGLEVVSERKGSEHASAVDQEGQRFLDKGPEIEKLEVGMN
jgi:hypothetical protein